MVLICISVAAGDVGHRFLCLLAILFFSLETRLFHLFARLYTELLIFLLLRCKSSQYFLDPGLLSDTQLGNVFSHSVVVLSVIVSK